MHKLRIPGAAVLFLLLGNIKWIVDTIGEVQTVSELPIIKYILYPAFSPVAFSIAILFIGWAYYDIRWRKEQAGFAAIPENKRRYRNQAIIGASIVLVLFVVAPLGYGYYRRHRNPSPLSQTASAQQPNPTNSQNSEAEERAIVLALIEDFKKSHNGQSPTLDWVNERLQKDGRRFYVIPPKEPASAPAAVFQLDESDGNKFNDIHSELDRPLAELNKSNRNEFSNMTAGKQGAKVPTLQTGPITTGPCSNVQIGSSGAQTTNCVQPNPNDPVVTYDFHGTKTVVTPGQPTQIYNFSDQDERSAFDQIVSLQNSHDLKGLADFCEQQIKKAPEWPTSYMCAGEAYAAMNQRQKGCDLLNQAAALAGKNQQWEEARFAAWQLACLHTK